LRSDWLLIYGQLEEPDGHPDIRYNDALMKSGLKTGNEEIGVLGY
jgi:hypothetical protein